MDRIHRYGRHFGLGLGHEEIPLIKNVRIRHLLLTQEEDAKNTTPKSTRGIIKNNPL